MNTIQTIFERQKAAVLNGDLAAERGATT